MDIIATSPLGGLAQRIVHSCDQLGQTPVLEVAPGLVLRDAFHLQLLSAVAEQAGRPVRLEVLAGDYGWWQNWLLSRDLKRWRRLAVAASELAGIDVTVERRMVLSRPAGKHRPLVLAIAGQEDSFPSWAQPLRLTTAPTHLDDIQLLAAV